MGTFARSVNCMTRGVTIRAVRTSGMADNWAKAAEPPCTWATWVSPLRTESASAAGAPARRKRMMPGLEGGPQ